MTIKSELIVFYTLSDLRSTINWLESLSYKIKTQPDKLDLKAIQHQSAGLARKNTSTINLLRVLLDNPCFQANGTISDLEERHKAWKAQDDREMRASMGLPPDEPEPSGEWG